MGGINYKKIWEWNSGFHDWVIRRHPHNGHKQNGFMGGFIFGERGQGKSTYALKVMAKVYFTLNGLTGTDGEGEAYLWAINKMIYEPQDFQHLTTYNKLHGIVTPILCLDDASMHFHNMLHITNPKEYAALLGQTATVRTAVTGLLITAPKRKHVVKFLRDYDDYKGEAFIDAGSGYDATHQNWRRKIRFYKWNYYPDEVKYRIKIPFQDKYSCYIPDEYYLLYVHRKGYFEIKHDMMFADKINKENRQLFIEYENDLPRLDGYPDLKKLYVDKWKKETEELEEERKVKEEKTKIKKLKYKLEKEKIMEKMNNVIKNRDKLEKI